MGLNRVGKALTAALLLTAGTATGAEINGRSSTQFLWYNNEFTEHRVIEAAEYLRIGVTKIDPAGKLSFFGYGRGAQSIGPDHDVCMLHVEFEALVKQLSKALFRPSCEATRAEIMNARLQRGQFHIEKNKDAV